jgi:zinc/manganese transport system substrate-binding protein
MRTIIFLSVLFLLPLATAASGRGATLAKLKVVAAENFYGDIASQIGGSRVAVTSILSDPNADPHLFEPGTSNGLAVATAKVVIQNGLGYDAFMQKLESASPSSQRIVVAIADALGFRGADTNPHVWYDVPKLPRVAQAIEAALERADPAGRAEYRSGLRRFIASLKPLQREVAAVRRLYAAKPVAYTEPVPGYLIEAAGLRNLAPPAFTHAIESGSEPPPQAVAAMTALLEKKKVRVLLYNSQAISPITAQVRAAAQRAGIPVVGVSETLPPRLHLQSWLLGETRALRMALARR